MTRPTPASPGFTLIELMVAVLVGSIVVAGIYMMYTISAGGYRIQNQTLDALGNLRTAAHQLRADLRSAGFNSPGNSLEEPWVVTSPATTLTAIAVEEDGSADTVHLPALNDNIQPLTLRILGDFWAHRAYRSATITSAATSVVTLEWAEGSPPSDDVHGDATEFDRIFTTSRFLRVEPYGVARAEYIFPIIGTAYDPIAPTITVNGSINVKGFGAGAEVTVLGYVRYRIAHADQYDPNSAKYDLVREEVDPTTNIGFNPLTIAEYIVDFQLYDFVFNVRAFNDLGASMRQTPVLLSARKTIGEFATGSVVSLAPDNTNSSHLLRALTVKIAARTPNEDPDVTFVPRPAIDQPLHAYELDPALPGAARVFEMASTSVLTAIQARRE